MTVYLTRAEMADCLREVLDCGHPEKEGRSYPIGRPASIETLNVLYETDIIDMVKARPVTPSGRWYGSERARMADEEDLGRAERRHEALFYHQAVEAFPDHFLQALYARNDCCFSSRKRTEGGVASFAVKPERCFERLTRVVELGARAETIEASVAEARALAEELGRS